MAYMALCKQLDKRLCKYISGEAEKKKEQVREMNKKMTDLRNPLMSRGWQTWWSSIIRFT